MAGTLAALVLAVAVGHHTLSLAPVHTGGGTVSAGARVVALWAAHNVLEWASLSRCLAASLLPTARSRAACWNARADGIRR
ncbi:hypothetical protein K1W54_27280 [Micromonospora sp. CPCC 205371]|nr:hypothetical protein [Micromonospora sp. CPCC 205371]